MRNKKGPTMPDEPETISTNKVRAGETRGNMRYVLLISVVIAVVVIAWLALRTDVASQEDRITGPSAVVE